MNADTHYKFKKDDANVAKGIGICMLIMYHLFYKEEVVYKYSPSFFPFGYQNVYLWISGLKSIRYLWFIVHRMFLEDREVPLDNNATEDALRSFCLHKYV